MTTDTRTRLNLETLEGRTLPATGFTGPVNATPLVVAHTSTPTPTPAPAAVPTVQSPVGATINGMRVVTRIFVNGALVLRVPGRPQFAGIGPAAFGDGNGSTETGGISLFANGRLLGTFAAPPQVTRQVTLVPGRNGPPVRLITFHITGPLYVAPAGPAGTANSANSAGTAGTVR